MPNFTPPETPDLQGLLASSIGIFLVGGFFSVWSVVPFATCTPTLADQLPRLFGVNSLQAWYYYQHYPTDTAIMKATVIHCAVSVAKNPWGYGASLPPGFSKPCMPSSSVIVFISTLYWVSATRTGWKSLFDVLQLSDWEHTSARKRFIAGIIVPLIYETTFGSDKLVNNLIFWAVKVGILTSVADLVVITLTIRSPTIILVSRPVYGASMLATHIVINFTRGGDCQVVWPLRRSGSGLEELV
ncbi:hypothetical protein BDN71DRAFT_1435835 [Pleurotus eryngii]|uniref:Uncharacterized protein n=1 Tax=Pleurotus eryngii TaxID=5323 RepID=A0A9P6D2Q5_PLEER|nr:hypothetical protein BDN71DRAFT_1435835 [Pleurotus eryngii]